MAVLGLIQQASITLGFESPKTIQIPSDINTQRLVGHLNRALESLVHEYDWQNLIKKCTVTLAPHVGVVEELYDLRTFVPDLDYFISNYIYDLTNKRRMTSISPDMAEAETFYNNDIDRKFAIRGGAIYFYPDLTRNTTISFWYKTRYAVLGAGYTLKQWFSEDSDTTFLDEFVLLRGLIWRYKSEIGADYAEAFRDYETYLNKLKDNDSNRRRIFDGGNVDNRPFAFTPDTGVGL